MSKTTITEAIVRLTFPGAPRVTTVNGIEFVPTVARWYATWYDTDPGEIDIRCLILASVAIGVPGIYYRSADEVPAWVPRPGDGWDLGVRIHAERVAIAAEAVSA